MTLVDIDRKSFFGFVSKKTWKIKIHEEKSIDLTWRIVFKFTNENFYSPFLQIASIFLFYRFLASMKHLGRWTEKFGPLSSANLSKFEYAQGSILIAFDLFSFHRNLVWLHCSLCWLEELLIEIWIIHQPGTRKAKWSILRKCINFKAKILLLQMAERSSCFLKDEHESCCKFRFKEI